MHTRETRDAVEQLAMLGVSAAQIAKRVALPRATVDSALAVTRNSATKERMDAAGMTLEEAALFAELEDDPGAIDALTRAWEEPWRRRQLPHIVQRLRDERTEAEALQTEVARLRAEGLPVLDPVEVPADLHRHTLANLRTEQDQPVPEDEWAQVVGAALAVTVEWAEPEYADDTDEADMDEGDGEQVYVPVWVCTDPEAAGLHYAYGPRTSHADDDSASSGLDAGAAVAAGSECSPASAAEPAGLPAPVPSTRRNRVASRTLSWASPPHHSTASRSVRPSVRVSVRSASPARASHAVTSASRSASAVTTVTASVLRLRSRSALA